jgi:5'-3' exonuclease
VLDLEEFMGMLTGIIIVYIIFGSIFGRLPGFRRSDRRERQRERDEIEEQARRQSAELMDQLSRLEERIKVLERIVTDDPRDLRRQFRDLGG